MEKIELFIKVYEDELSDLGRIKNKTKKNEKEIELIEQFISELKEIGEEHDKILLTTISTTKLFTE